MSNLNRCFTFLSNFERNYQWNYQPQLVDIEMEFENLAIDNLPQTMCLAEKMSTGSFRTNWRNLRDLSNLKNDVNALKTFELGDLQTFQTKAVIVQTGKFHLFSRSFRQMAIVHILIRWPLSTRQKMRSSTEDARYATRN